MLSSVSYVCLGVCAGMWVISRVCICACSFCLSYRSYCSSVRVIFICSWLFRVCVCSFCFYFADVSSSAMWSDLRAAVPQESSALQSLASSLPDVALASRAPSTSYFSSYNRWSSWGREHGLTVFPASPFHFAICLRRFITEAKTTSPLESAVHSITWFHQVASRLLLIIRW